MDAHSSPLTRAPAPAAPPERAAQQSLLSSAGFGLAAALKLDIALSDTASRAFSTTPGADGGAAVQTFVFSSREDIVGEVKLTVLGGKKVEHAGVRIELKGVVELAADKTTHEFVSLVRELAAPGASQGMAALHFRFAQPELPHESYVGLNARVRYFLRAVVGSKGGFAAAASLVREQDITVQTVTAPPALPASAAGSPPFAGTSDNSAAATAAADTSPIGCALLRSDSGEGGVGGATGAGSPGAAGVKLEVGIEDCLHIEFVFDRTQFHLADVVTGRVYFLLVRIRIKHMELSLIRREFAGLPGSVLNESETLTRFELMDGAPVKGERIPIRMFLAGLDIAPSLTNVANCLTVRYFLNLVLVDEEDRRYFKQCEVTLYRHKLGKSAVAAATPQLVAGSLAAAAQVAGAPALRAR